MAGRCGRIPDAWSRKLAKDGIGSLAGNVKYVAACLYRAKSCLVRFT